MPCEPASQQLRNGRRSCLSCTAARGWRSASRPADTDPSSDEQPAPPRRPPAEAAQARRYARRWWVHAASCHRRQQLSAPQPQQQQQQQQQDSDAEWTLIEPDGLGPDPEPQPVVGRLRRPRRPPALRRAAAALQQCGMSVIGRLAAAGRQRAEWRLNAPVCPNRPAQVVRCGHLFSPEPGLSLFESVSCGNLAELAGQEAPEPDAVDDDSPPPPPYPDHEPPPYSLAVSRPSPVERLLWHGLDADQVTVTSSPAATGAPSRPTPAERALWASPPSAGSGSPRRSVL